MKILNRKIYSLLLVVSTLTLLSSCKDDFLDRQAQGEYNENTYPYPEGGGPYDEFIFGIYSDLRSYNVSGFGFISAVSIRSDDADKGSTASDGSLAKQMDEFTITASNAFNENLWLGYLGIVIKANEVLDKVKRDPNPNIPEATKTDAIAQARFFRGYSYFMLVRLFGNVPLIDSVLTTVSSANIPQSTPEQIYNFVEQDLQYAAANLRPKSSYDPKFIGRATSGAAHGLLAKVYLHQQKWDQAMKEARIVINSGEYDLKNSYFKIFDESGENSTESIFEVQATASPEVPQSNGTQYNQIQGVRGSNEWNRGWGFNNPSESLVAAYEADDPRKDRTILFAGGKSLWGEDVPVGLTNPRYNNKISTPPAKQSFIGSRSGWWMNIRLLRYADVVLMYAEAANEVGGAANIDSAKKYLNKIRERARNGNNNILPDVTTTDRNELRNAIRHERRIELAMEHERFFDLVRWGIAASTLADQGKTFVVGRHEYLPIPQTQIDISNNVLKQFYY